MTKLPVPPAKNRWAQKSVVQDTPEPSHVPVERSSHGSVKDERICAECGESFTGPKRKRFCSAVCRVKAHRRGETVECPECRGTGRVLK